MQRPLHARDELQALGQLRDGAPCAPNRSRLKRRSFVAEEAGSCSGSGCYNSRAPAEPISAFSYTRLRSLVFTARGQRSPNSSYIF